MSALASDLRSQLEKAVIRATAEEATLASLAEMVAEHEAALREMRERRKRR